MKIAFIGQKGIPASFGGVERHTHDLAVRLVEIGYEVTAFCRAWYTESMAKEYQGIKLEYVWSTKTKHLDTISYTFLAVLRALRGGYDIIHFHGVGPALLSFIPRIFARNIVIITTFHSIDRKHEKWGLLARMVLFLGEWMTCQFSHRVIAVSKTIGQYIRDVYDVDFDYIPNAIETYPREIGTTALETFGVIPNKYILVVSRFVRHKGLHYIISAWKRLKLSDEYSDFKLVIVGDGHFTDEYVQELHNMSSGIESIVFTGFQSGKNLREFFSHAFFMIHASDKEGLPINVLEGMGFGLPMLVSDIPEHLEFDLSRDCYFKRGNIDDLKNKIQNIFEKTERSRAMISNKNRNIINKNYSWKNIVLDVSDVYIRLVPKSKVEIEKRRSVKDISLSDNKCTTRLGV